MAAIDNGKTPSTTETKRKDSSAQRQSDDEDWTKLTDISSRRRIQNRIAQRNRRKKLKESRDRSKTPEPGSHSRGGSIGGSKSPDLPPQSEQNGPKFVIDTPYLSQNGSNSNRPLIFLDTMSTTDTKALMTQLEQAQSQLQEFMAGKQSTQQLPTPPRTSQDMGATASVDWDPSWLSTFDNDDMALLGQDLDSLSAMPGLMGPSSDRFCLDPSLQDDEPSTTRSTINVLPQTTNADSLYLTPPTTSVPFPMQRAASAPAIPHFPTSSEFLPTPPLPQPTRSRSHSNVSDMSTSSSNHDASSHGNTALHLATLKGHLPIIRLLLQTSSPSQLNTANLSGQTPLHLAIITKNQPVAHFLISQHADTSALTHNNESILHLAVESGSTEMVELCLDLASELRDKRDSEGRTAFHRAVAGGNEGIVRLLLQRGVNHQAKVGDQTPTLGDDFTFDWGMVGH